VPLWEAAPSAPITTQTPLGVVYLLKTHAVAG